MDRTNLQIEGLREQLRKCRMEFQERQTVLQDELEEMRLYVKMVNEVASRMVMREFGEENSYEKELEQIAEKLGEGQALENYRRYVEKKKELEQKEKESEEKNKAVAAEIIRIQEEIEHKENEKKQLEQTLEEEKKKIEQITLFCEDTKTEIHDTRSRLSNDKELLDFLDHQDGNIIDKLEKADQLLCDAEKVIENAIRMKENKAEKIQEIVRGEKIFLSKC